MVAKEPKRMLRSRTPSDLSIAVGTSIHIEFLWGSGIPKFDDFVGDPLVGLLDINRLLRPRSSRKKEKEMLLFWEFWGTNARTS